MVSKIKVDTRGQNMSHNAVAKILQKQLLHAIRSDPIQQALPQVPTETFDFNFNGIPRNDMSQISNLTKTLQNNVMANNINELNANLNNVENEYSKMETNGQYDRIKRNIEIVDNFGDITRNDDVKNILHEHSKNMKGKYLYLSKDSQIYKIMELMKTISEIAKSDFNRNEVINKFSELTIEIKYYLKSEKNYTDLREALTLFVDELKTKYENNTQKGLIIENINKLLENVKYIYSSQRKEYAEILNQIKEIKQMSVYNPSTYYPHTNNPSVYGDFEDMDQGEQIDDMYQGEPIDDREKKNKTNDNNNNNDGEIEIYKNRNRPEDMPIEKKMVINVVKLWDSDDAQDVQKRVDILVDNEKLLVTTNPKVFKNIFIEIYGDKKLSEFSKYSNQLMKIIFDANYENYSKTGNLPYIANYVNNKYHIEAPPTRHQIEPKDAKHEKEEQEEQEEEEPKQIGPPPTGKQQPKQENKITLFPIMGKNIEGMRNNAKVFTKEMIKPVADNRQEILSMYLFKNLTTGKTKIIDKIMTLLTNLGIDASFSYQGNSKNDLEMIGNLNGMYPGLVKTKREVLNDFIINTLVYFIPFVSKDLWKKDKEKLNAFIFSIYGNETLSNNVITYYGLEFRDEINKRVGFKD